MIKASINYSKTSNTTSIYLHQKNQIQISFKLLKNNEELEIVESPKNID